MALIVDSRPDVIPRHSSVFLFDSSGHSRGTYTGSDTSAAFSNPFGLTEQLDGFELKNCDSDTGSEVVAIDGTGSVVGSTGKIDASFVLVAIDPLGGVVVSSRPRDFSSPARAIAAYDERARLRWRTELPSSDAIVAVGVDRQGNTLALLGRYGSGKLAGTWLDHSGRAGSVFEAADIGNSPQEDLLLTPRVESGLFLRRSDGAWIRQFDAFGPGQAPPSWLEARASTTLHMARGGPGLRGDFAPAPKDGRRVPGHDRGRHALGKELWHLGIPGREERLQRLLHCLVDGRLRRDGDRETRRAGHGGRRRQGLRVQLVDRLPPVNLRRDLVPDRLPGHGFAAWECRERASRCAPQHHAPQPRSSMRAVARQPGPAHEEVASKGVTVNTVSPGYIGTEMMRAIKPEVLEKIVALIPVRRLGTPEEIGGMVGWLASDDSSFATGADFSINGGLHMG